MRKKTLIGKRQHAFCVLPEMLKRIDTARWAELSVEHKVPRCPGGREPLGWAGLWPEARTDEAIERAVAYAHAKGYISGGENPVDFEGLQKVRIARRNGHEVVEVHTPRNEWLRGVAEEFLKSDVRYILPEKDWQALEPEFKAISLPLLELPKKRDKVPVYLEVGQDLARRLQERMSEIEICNRSEPRRIGRVGTLMRYAVEWYLRKHSAKH